MALEDADTGEWEHAVGVRGVREVAPPQLRAGRWITEAAIRSDDTLVESDWASGEPSDRVDCELVWSLTPKQLGSLAQRIGREVCERLPTHARFRETKESPWVWIRNPQVGAIRDHWHRVAELFSRYTAERGRAGVDAAGDLERAVHLQTVRTAEHLDEITDPEHVDSHSIPRDVAALITLAPFLRQVRSESVAAHGSSVHRVLTRRVLPGHGLSRQALRRLARRGGVVDVEDEPPDPCGPLSDDVVTGLRAAGEWVERVTRDGARKRSKRTVSELLDHHGVVPFDTDAYPTADRSDHVERRKRQKRMLQDYITAIRGETGLSLQQQADLAAAPDDDSDYIYTPMLAWSSHSDRRSMNPDVIGPAAYLRYPVLGEAMRRAGTGWMVKKAELDRARERVLAGTPAWAAGSSR